MKYITIIRKNVLFLICLLCFFSVGGETAYAASPTLGREKIVMTVGEKKTIALKHFRKLFKKEIRKVRWQSSNKKIVGVRAKGQYRQKGVLTAKTEGKATISVKFDGKVYKRKVVVKKPEWKVTQHSSASGGQAMFYTIEDNKGDLVLIDGGYVADAAQVSQVIATHGNHVSAWIITHPHPDHAGAFNAIAASMEGITIDHIYAVEVHGKRYGETARDYDQIETYETFLKVTGEVTNLTYLYENDELDLLGLHMKVLHTWDEDTDALTVNLCNNGSMCFTLAGAEDKMLFCADVENETETFILNRHLQDITDVDYIQTGHHGNWGMTTDFYGHMNPKAVFFDSGNNLLEPGNLGYDAGKLKNYFEGRGIAVYNFSTAPNQVTLQ